MGERRRAHRVEGLDDAALRRWGRRTPPGADQPEHHRVARADGVAGHGCVVLWHVADADVASPAGWLSTSDGADATGTSPSTTCSSVILPIRSRPMTAVMPPDGTVERAFRPDQRAAADDADVVEGQRRGSATDTERLGQGGELVHLPSLERFRARRQPFR